MKTNKFVKLFSTLLFFCSMSVLAQNPITRIQSKSGNSGTGNSSSFTVTMSSTPANGNTFVAIIATNNTASGTVSSISQSGASWTRATQATNTNGTTTEIWYAPNVSSAGTTITINQASCRSAAVVIEYNNIALTSPLDQTASTTGNSATASTGTTAATYGANELLIAGIGLERSDYSLGTATNSFTTVATTASTNNSPTNNAKVYALEKLVSATGTAASGGTISTGSQWSGAIATFKEKNNSVSVASSSPTLCINTTLTNITHRTSGATGIGTATGLPLGVNSSWASNIITISGTPTESGTFTYNIPLTGGFGSMNATGTITVSPVSVGGTIAGITTVCSGANSTALTLSGHTGSIIRWETSLNNFATAGTSIANTTTTLTATNLTATTYYRAVLTSGSCSTVNSATTSITVSPVVTITLGTNPTITQGTTSANLPFTANNAAQVYVTFNAAAVAAGFVGSQSGGISGASGNIILQVPYCPTSGAGTYGGTLYVGTFSPTCTSTTYPFSVTITSSPAPTGTASQGFCSTATVANLTATGTSILWYGASSGGSSLPTATVLVNGNHYYASQNSAGCESSARFDVTATVSPTTVGGTVAGSATVCTGTNSTALTLSGHIGAITRWESSLDNFATAGTSIANTNTTLTRTNLSATTYYRAVLTSGSCASANSATATVTVSANNTVGAASSTPTICINTALTNITHTTTGATGILNAGTAGVNGLPAGVAASFNSNTITIFGTPSASGTFSYSIPLTGGCGSVNAIGTITVSAASVGGTVAGNATVCTGTNSTTLTLSGHTGAITRWESSLDNFATAGTSIATTTTTLTVTNLTTTTYYRAVLTNGSCASVNSTKATVTVSPSSIGGTIAGSATVCTGTNSTALTLSGHTGAITRWESSLDNFATAGTSIANTNTTLARTNLTATIYYRAVLTSGSCASANSATATVTVSPASVGGTVAGSATVCSGTNSITLILNGHTGTITRWELSNSSTFASGVNSISNTTNTLTTTNLTTTTYYRAVLTSGACAAANSATATVTVSPTTVGGTTSVNETLCAGTTPLNNITLSGNTGNVIKWQSALDALFTNALTDIANTSITLTVTNIGVLTATTYFRAVVQSGSCATAYSSTTTKTVTTVTTGSVSGASANCIGASGATTTLTLTGNTGSRRWQSSTDNISFANVGNNTLATFAAPIATVGTVYYRVNVTSGVCTGSSPSFSLIVSPTSVGGIISGGETVCTGTNSTTLTLSGYTGAITRWESSTSSTFASAVTSIANTTNSLTATNLIATSYFRAILTSSPCSSANSVTATITVSPASVGGSVAGSATVCTGTNSTALTLSSHTGTITRWESSLDNFATAGTSIDNTTTTLTVSNMTTTTYYRAVLTSGVCAAANSATATITVSPASLAGIISGDVTVCSRFNATTLNLTGSIGNIQWQSSSSFSGPFLDINGATNSNYLVTNLTSSTYYRAVVKNSICSSVTSEIAKVTLVTTISWTGLSDTSWNYPNNWSCEYVPNATDDVIVGLGTNQPIISSDIAINSLTINSGASLTVPTGFDLTVTNFIHNNGTLTVENNANLIQTNDVSNSGAITVRRNSSSILRLDHVLWSSPVTGSQTLQQFSPATLSNRFYTYTTSSSNFTATPAASLFTAGKGYVIRAENTISSTQTTIFNGSFEGVPNNGNVSFTLATDGLSGKNFNLVGNPYPSTIDVTAFLDGNRNVLGTIYFYTHSLTMIGGTGPLAGTFPQGTNYSSRNRSGHTVSTHIDGDLHPVPSVPNGTIQVGQGFLVKALTGGTVTFTNAMRTGNNGNQFLRTTEIEKHRIWLNLKTDAGTDINQMMVGYIEGATQAVDTDFDGLLFGNTGSSLSSKLDGAYYGIQGRSLPFDSSDIVPLSFKASATGNYMISLTNTDGLFAGSQDIFVRDNLLGTDHNIKFSPYTFASDAGTFDSRFELVYTQALVIPSTDFTPNSVIVYKNTDWFHVNTKGITMKGIQVFDISGSLIYKKSDINSTTAVLTGLTKTNEILFLKIISEDNVTVTLKVIN